MAQTGPGWGRVGREVVPTGLFTAKQLASMLAVPLPRVRAWLRAGLIRPTHSAGGEAWFDLRQIANARTLQRLARAGARPATLRRGLERMRQWLPDADAALARVEALERGAMLVRLDDGRLADTSGQLRFDFERRPSATVHQVDDHRSSEGWFEEGIRAEEDGRLDDAARAYQNALLVGGPEAETAFNLGNVLWALDRRGAAAQRYMQAIEVEPHFAEAWNNLGNALAELAQPDDAIRAYRRALRIAPDYADAHFNLAETLESLGRIPEARQHWQAYLTCDPHSAWATHVRERLAQTAPA